MSHKHVLNVFTPDFRINLVTREVIQIQPDVLIKLMQYDHNSEKLRFECPRFIDGHDMSLCNKVEVHFINTDITANISKGGYYTVTDVAVNNVNSNLINFSWVVSRNATENVGTLVFSVRFICTTGDVIDYVWHTLPFTYVSVDQGLVNELDPEYQKIYLDNLETEAGKIVVEAAEAKTTALEAAERASEAINDLYSMDVTDKAPAIVCEVSGEVISITDSANMPLKGLRLFGKSTQDGTPTPTAPVEIVSVNNPLIKIYGKNLIESPYLEPTTRNGVTVSNTSDGGISVKGTATAYVEFLLGGGYNTSKTGLSFDAILSGGTNTIGLHVFRYDETGKFIGVATSNGNTKDVLASAGMAIAISVEVDSTVDEVIYPMLTVNVNTAEFERYKVPQTLGITCTLHGVPVTSGGNYTDSNGQQWICDEIDLERGVYVQRIKQHILNGTEAWTTNNGSVYYLSFQDMYKGGGTSGAYLNGFMFNRYPHSKTWDAIATTDGVACVYWHESWEHGRIAIHENSCSTVDEFKSYLVNHNVVCLYTLATPVEIALTETEIAAYKALHTNKPNTIILTDSGAWQSVDYVADTKLYIDNKFAELANR